MEDKYTHTKPGKTLENHNQRKNQRREEIQWQERMQTKPKLRTYIQLKTKLQYEHTYLNTRDKEAREVMTRLRGGTNELRVETGRYAITNRDRPLELTPADQGCRLLMSTAHRIRLPLLAATLLIMRATSSRNYLAVQVS